MEIIFALVILTLIWVWVKSKGGLTKAVASTIVQSEKVAASAVEHGEKVVNKTAEYTTTGKVIAGEVVNQVKAVDWKAKKDAAKQSVTKTVKEAKVKAEEAKKAAKVEGKSHMHNLRTEINRARKGDK